MTGTYQWDATYSGDANNNAASDQRRRRRAGDGQPASPTLTTTPNPTTVTLGATPADPDRHGDAGRRLSTRPARITFTLLHGGSTLVDTETVTVSGNGTYTTPTGFTLPTTGTVTGTYQWDATYSGDANNNAASDSNAASEQVTVSTASPTLETTASPTTVTLARRRSRRSDRHGGRWRAAITRPARITFTLTGPGGVTVDTETVTVSGNGTYTTPTGYTLPTTGTVTGTYTVGRQLQRRRQQQRRQRPGRRRRAE